MLPGRQGEGPQGGKGGLASCLPRRVPSSSPPLTPPCTARNRAEELGVRTAGWGYVSFLSSAPVSTSTQSSPPPKRGGGSPSRQWRRGHRDPPRRSPPAAHALGSRGPAHAPSAGPCARPQGSTCHRRPLAGAPCPPLTVLRRARPEGGILQSRGAHSSSSSSSPSWDRGRLRAAAAGTGPDPTGEQRLGEQGGFRPPRPGLPLPEGFP